MNPMTSVPSVTAHPHTFPVLSTDVPEYHDHARAAGEPTMTRKTPSIVPAARSRSTRHFCFMLSLPFVFVLCISPSCARIAITVRVKDIDRSHSFGLREVLHTPFLPLQMSSQVRHAMLA